MLRRVMLLVAVLGLTAGCRLAGGAPPSSEPATPPSSQAAIPPSSQAVAPSASTSRLVVDEETAAWCGFPVGTALSYAGRSTAAALKVDDGMPERMSNAAADIYITRDKFGQGNPHGRLVCLMFVDEHGFVVVTIHPEDGGRFVFFDEPSPVPSPLPSGSIQILTHCGLDEPRIEYAGGLWKFDRVENQSSAPAGWGLGSTVVQIKPGPDGPIVIGPFGIEWQLVPADPSESPNLCL